jgi:glutaminyl-tRNA synthetase
MSETPRKSNFLTDIIDADLAAGRVTQVVTRFPPEPNGFLHIGHSKSILLNFGLGQQYRGKTHLRFDDTNPVTEETLFVEGIQADVKWLGADWGKALHFASDFFPQMYERAVRLIREGHAYVDTQSVDAIREQRGDFDKPGTNSPFRDRPIAESLQLFQEMRDGKLPDGSAVLRARIDMAHPNVLMRDPLLYRIRHAHHHRTGDTWPIYPMYDYAHPLEDALEGITHSICTLEFESNRPLYDWVLDHTGPWNPRPRQYEFARLVLGYTVMSKRKLKQLVLEKRVSGWDDPRMPTVVGMKRRGVTPEALREFNELIGVAKNNSIVDLGKFEHAIRTDLEGRSLRANAVLNPLQVTLTNWPRDRVDALDLAWWPGEPEKAGSRKVPFGAQLLIEREDFSLSPPADWKRLAVGTEVRLLGAYVIRCEEAVQDAQGNVTELRCSVDLQSQGGTPADGRKIAGSLNWVHATRSIAAPVRLYDRLFTEESPDALGDAWLQALNPSSLVVARDARVEEALGTAKAGDRFQFLRQGYFFVDPVESRPGAPVFNRTMTLKDTWAKAPEKLERKARDSKVQGGPRRSRAEIRAEMHAAHPERAHDFARLQKLGLTEDEADTLSADAQLALYVDDALSTGAPAKAVARWAVNELLGALKGRALEVVQLAGKGFGQVVLLAESGKLSASATKTLLAHLLEKGGDPQAVLRELGLDRVADAGALAGAVDKVLASQATEVARYRAGETKLLGVFIGAVMKETGGTADAAAVRKLVAEKLS